MMGFFYQDNIQSQIGFLRTSTEESVDDFSLDESIDVVGGRNRVRIVASSKGFLLCTPQRTRDRLHVAVYDTYTEQYVPIPKLLTEYPRKYFVYDPATKQSVTLPKSQYRHKEVATGFSCNVDHDDLVSFTIVRYGKPKLWLEVQSNVMIECFSSETSEWTAVDIKLGVPHCLYPVENPAVVIDGVYFWLDRGPQIIAIDAVAKSCWPLDLPEIEFHAFYYLFFSREGLYYASVEGDFFRVWVLQSSLRCTDARWLIKYEGNFSAIIDEYPELFVSEADSKNYKNPLGLHPDYPQIIYFDRGTKVISFDMDNNTAEHVDTFGQSPWFTQEYNYFPYERSKRPCLLPVLNSGLISIPTFV